METDLYIDRHPQARARVMALLILEMLRSREVVTVADVAAEFRRLYPASRVTDKNVANKLYAMVREGRLAKVDGSHYANPWRLPECPPNCKPVLLMIRNATRAVSLAYVARNLEISLPAVYQQVAILQKLRLVVRRRQGQYFAPPAKPHKPLQPKPAAKTPIDVFAD